MYIEISNDTFSTKYTTSNYPVSNRRTAQSALSNNFNNNINQNGYNCSCNNEKLNFNGRSRNTQNKYFCTCGKKHDTRNQYSNFESFNQNGSSSKIDKFMQECEQLCETLNYTNNSNGRNYKAQNFNGNDKYNSYNSGYSTNSYDRQANTKKKGEDFYSKGNRAQDPVKYIDNQQTVKKDNFKSNPADSANKVIIESTKFYVTNPFLDEEPSTNIPDLESKFQKKNSKDGNSSEFDELEEIKKIREEFEQLKKDLNEPLKSYEANSSSRERPKTKSPKVRSPKPKRIKEVIIERIIEVPKEKIVEKIVEHQVEKVIEVPVIEIEEKVVEVPVQVIKKVEKEHFVVKEIPNIIHKNVVTNKEVIVSVQKEKIVEVPNYVEYEVEKIVEVPRIVEVIEEKSIIKEVEQIVEVPKEVEVIEEVEKIINKNVEVIKIVEIKKEVEVLKEVEVEKIEEVEVLKPVKKEVASIALSTQSLENIKNDVGTEIDVANILPGPSPIGFTPSNKLQQLTDLFYAGFNNDEYQANMFGVNDDAPDFFHDKQMNQSFFVDLSKPNSRQTSVFNSRINSPTRPKNNLLSSKINTLDRYDTFSSKINPLEKDFTVDYVYNNDNRFNAENSALISPSPYQAQTLKNSVIKDDSLGENKFNSDFTINEREEETATQKSFQPFGQDPKEQMSPLFNLSRKNSNLFFGDLNNWNNDRPAKRDASPIQSLSASFNLEGLAKIGQDFFNIQNSNLNSGNNTLRASSNNDTLKASDNNDTLNKSNNETDFNNIGKSNLVSDFGDGNEPQTRIENPKLNSLGESCNDLFSLKASHSDMGKSKNETEYFRQGTDVDKSNVLGESDDVAGFSPTKQNNKPTIQDMDESRGSENFGQNESKVSFGVGVHDK